MTKKIRVGVIYLLILLWMINASYIQKGNWNLAEMSGRQILTYINRKKFKMLKKEVNL